MDFTYVGKDFQRPDALEKAQGKSIYIDDIRLPGMLHAEILRPEYAHAKIISIDTRAAEACEGVVAVVTGANCPYSYGDNIRDLIPMAVTKVRYIGEPVAAVIAESRYQAVEAMKKIIVKYKPLPVYVDALEAMKPGATLIQEQNGEIWHLPHIHPVPGTNIAGHYVLRKGDFEKALAEADYVVEGEFDYPFGSSAAIETHGAIVWFQNDGKIDCWSSSICPFIIREDLANTYGVPISDVRVRIPEIGGCFGYKSDITIEQTVAWIASHARGRPVKWIASRKADLESTLIGHGIRTRMKIAARRDGIFLGLQTRSYLSTGAYADTGINISHGATHNSTGPYVFDNCDLQGYSVYTNTPPVGAYRGYGHQEALFATERIVDMLARKMGIDPFVLREKNYMRPGSINALGEKMYMANGSVMDCARKVREAIFRGGKPTEDERYFYGRGFAAVMKSPKGAPNQTKGCYLKLNKDGSATVTIGGAEVGQGLRTVVQQICGEALKIPPHKVRVNFEIDTLYSPYEWQTIGSMFTTMGGRAILRAADRVIAILKKNASYALRCDEDFLEYDGQWLYVKSDPDCRVAVRDVAQGYMLEDGRTVGELAQATSDARLPRYSGFDQNGQGGAGVSYTFGAQGCELRIEKSTGKVTIDHFASSFDVGKVISPRQIRGQVAGGVLMAIGATLYEKLEIGADGKIANPHFGKYHLPTASEAPGRQTIEFVENPDVVGPFGSRGIGEHPVLGVAPAILNAIHDAIGIEFTDIPVTPARILDALKNREMRK
ncbi:MAG: xanthine dehydrogenase family protein molybdopterin-binding subunit [Spirochaetes bacterium]|nr:xanthine dehydrogenase family protein molybdopterin-binding subunit [Spirochaetota bacterium]